MGAVMYGNVEGVGAETSILVVMRVRCTRGSGNVSLTIAVAEGPCVTVAGIGYVEDSVGIGLVNGEVENYVAITAVGGCGGVVVCSCGAFCALRMQIAIPVVYIPDIAYTCIYIQRLCYNGPYREM